MTNELEQLKKTNAKLRDIIDSLKHKQMCPALQEANETIEQLRKQLEEHKNYERNSLLKEPDNAAN